MTRTVGLFAVAILLASTASAQSTGDEAMESPMDAPASDDGQAEADSGATGEVEEGASEPQEPATEGIAESAPPPPAEEAEVAPEPPPQPLSNEAWLYEDEARAEDAYRVKDGKFIFDEARLSEFNYRARTTWVPGGLSVGAVPTSRETAAGSCFAAIELSVGSSSDPVTVDWESSSFVINGRAVPALPGFVRRMNKDRDVRKSTAPAGANIVEAVVPQSEDCFPDGEHKLVVAMTVASEPRQVEIELETGWVARSEAEVLAVMRKPTPLHELDEPGFAYLWTSILGGGGAACGLFGGGAIAALAAVGASQDPGRSQEERTQTYIAGAAVAGLTIGCCGGTGLLAGFFLDQSSRSRAAKYREEIQYREAYEREQAMAH